MTEISDSVQVFCNLEIGKKTFIGNGVIIGYPDSKKMQKALSEGIAIDNIKTDTVTIGSNGIIRDGAIIYERVRIGDSVNTGHSFQIREDTIVGSNCIIGTKPWLFGVDPPAQTVIFGAGN